MHTWWLPRGHLGAFAFRMRTWGIEESFLGRLSSDADAGRCRALMDQRFGDDEERTAYADYLKGLEERTVELQVFDFEDRYMVRVLARRLLRGRVDADDTIDALPYTEAVDYDDRSDVTDEELPNKAYARMLDEMIHSRRYIVIETFSVSDFLDRITRLAFEMDDPTGAAVARMAMCDGPCGGRGYLPDEEHSDCPVCDGRGTIVVGTLRPPGRVTWADDG